MDGKKVVQTCGLGVKYTFMNTNVHVCVVCVCVCQCVVCVLVCLWAYVVHVTSHGFPSIHACVCPWAYVVHVPSHFVGKGALVLRQELLLGTGTLS